MPYLKHNLLLVLLLAGLIGFGAVAQEPPPKASPGFPPDWFIPENLEEMLAWAMDRNPKIKLAEAKLRQAQAELNAARLEVAQEVAEVHGERLRLRQMITQTERIKEYGDAEALIELGAQLNAAEARARYLLGVGAFPMPGEQEGPHEAPMRPAARPPVPPEMAGRLEKRLDIELEPMPLTDALERLGAAADVQIMTDLTLPPVEVALAGQDLTVGEALTALADQCDFLCFVVRDYGLFATVRDRARQIQAPAIPGEVPLFVPELPPAEPE